MGRIEGLGVWPARALWGVLALVSSSSFGAALAGRSTLFAVVAWILLAVGWTAGAVAFLVPRSTSLTVIRLVVPAALAAVVWAAAVGDGVGPLDVVTAAVAALAVAAILTPWVTEEFVNGSAYGPEQRTPLRTPAFLWVLAPITWAVAVVGAVGGPLLLGAGRWLAGGVALVVGWAVAFASARSLHQLARRWVVIVPAGLVIHDPLTMPEPQLFLRRSIRRVTPAAADAAPVAVMADGQQVTTEDLTAGAPGLVLELIVDEPIELLVRVGRGTTATRSVGRVLFAPARPLTVLDAARRRSIPVP